jgi:glycosyltransferase involved in cell wall biosynthesis
MQLSVVMPVYNERATLLECVRRVLATPFDKELIIVDDASTDGTRALAERIAAAHPSEIRLIVREKNGGKGSALRQGIAAARGDVVLIQDADLEYHPRDYARLLRPFEEGLADVVFGSRFLASDHRVLYYWHSVGNHVLTTLSNIFTNLNLTDMETCYKVFRREIVQKIHIEENRFGFEPEITAKVARLRCRIYEVGISYAGRTYEEGKKMGWKDGVRAIWCILKYNLRSSDPVAVPAGEPPSSVKSSNRPADARE